MHAASYTILTDMTSPGQLGALFEGLDWKRVHSRRVARPQLAQ